MYLKFKPIGNCTWNVHCVRNFLKLWCFLIYLSCSYKYQPPKKDYKIERKAVKIIYMCYRLNFMNTLIVDDQCILITQLRGSNQKVAQCYGKKCLKNASYWYHTTYTMFKSECIWLFNPSVQSTSCSPLIFFLRTPPLLRQHWSFYKKKICAYIGRNIWFFIIFLWILKFGKTVWQCNYS